MPMIKFSNELITEFKTLSKLKWSYSVIINHFENINVSKSYLAKLNKEILIDYQKSPKKTNQ